MPAMYASSSCVSSLLSRHSRMCWPIVFLVASVMIIVYGVIWCIMSPIGHIVKKPRPCFFDSRRRSVVQDEVLFTPQMASAVARLNRAVGQIVKECCRMSCLDFHLLSSIRSHGGEMTLDEFPCDALGQKNTVVASSAHLFRAGLVEKGRCSDDGRVVLLRETEAGACVLKESYDRLYDGFRSSAWKDIGDSEMREALRAAVPVLEALGIGEVEINQKCHAVLAPALFMGVSALLRRWEDVVSSFANLSFSEYRCLALLANSVAPVSCGLMAAVLSIDRGSASAIAAKLGRRGMVLSKRGLDQRYRELALSEKGEAVAALVTSRLGRLTAKLYSGMNALAKAQTNEMHMRIHTILTSL